MKKAELRIALFVLLFSLQACGIFRKKGGTELTYEEKRRFEEAYFKASTEKILGNSESAIKSFKEALDIDPSCHACMYQIANLSYAGQMLDDAVYWAEASIKYNPTYNFWYYGQLGQFYNRKGDYLKSAEVFVRMAEFEPNRATNYLEAANQYINASEFKKSLEILEKYESKFGTDEESARKIEGLWTQLGKPDKANEALERLVKANPGNVRYMGLLAESYLRNDRVADARKLYERIIELEADNGFAHFGLSDIYRKNGEEQKSFHHLKMAFLDEDVSIALKMQVVQSFLPFIRLDSSMRNKVVTLLDALVITHPNEPNVFIAYSDVLYTSGHPELSREKLKRGLELDASNYNAWLQLIALDSELESYELMAEDAKSFLDRFPLQALPYLSYSHACMNLGNYKKALEIANEGLEISRLKDDKIQFLITIATSHYELGEYGKSDAAHDELLELDPNDALALNNYAYFLAERGERLGDALNMINKALKQEADNVSYLDTKGWVLFQQGSYSEAEVVLRRAAKLEPDDPEILTHLMKTLLKLNKLEEAAAIQEKIKAITGKTDS